MEGGTVWRQFIIAGIANLGITAVGFCMGWTSPVNVKLLNVTQSPLPDPITRNEGSWIGSLLNVGGVIGPFMAGYLSSRIGRKWSVISGAVPLAVGWVLIADASNIGFIYIGRIFWGVGAGMLFTATPMYCAEIATTDCRGALGSLLQVFITCGFLIVYAVGPFLSYDEVSYVGSAIVIVFVIGFCFMPESPTYYLLKDNKEAAARCLMTLRGKPRAGIEHELALMEADAKTSLAKTGMIANVFCGSNLKAFKISCTLVFFQQFCGVNAVLFYMNTIFEAARSDLDPAIATIVIGAVQSGASLTTPMVVDRLGRKILLLISCAGTAICLGLLGLFFILDAHHSPVAKTLDFLPILSLVFFIISFNFGLGPLPWTIMNEVFPIEVKAAATSMTTAYCWILSFATTRYFEPIADAVGMYTAFWIFGVCCVAGFFYTLFFVPETKGKSFSEIQDMLAGDENSSMTNHEKAEEWHEKTSEWEII